MSSANETTKSALNNEEEANDVVWVLTSAFLIFTMQSGYGILESGFVSRKNEVNIMVKNATTVLIGGLIFWVFGFGLSFDYMTNPYFSFGDLFKSADDRVMGVVYSRLVFQLAYCTTSTTLISGAMAERCKFVSYIIFIVFATVIYCVPAAWLWNQGGWLNKMGAVDIGGSGVVHLVGASTGLMGSILLGPRLGRYDFGFSEIPLGNPTNALLGMFMLWWGWLGFNAGSTGGVVHNKWKYSARASVTTILASMSGGLVGMGLSFVLKRRLHDVSWLVNSVMGSLVAISGGAPIVRPWQALVIGAIASALVLLCIPLMRLLKIDDPTENFVTHGVCGVWGLIAIGLFPEADNLINYTKGKAGLFVSGDWTLLKNQIITAVCLMSWCCSTSLIALLLIKLTIGLRMPPEEEILGPDLVDHEIEHDYNADLMKTFRAYYQRSVQEKVVHSSTATRKRNRPTEKY